MNKGKVGLVVAALVAGVFSLTACKAAAAKPKQADLSGTYYYVQNMPNPMDDNENMIHGLALRRADSSNKKYVAEEIGMGGTTRDEGKLTVDGDIINIKLPKKSWLLDKGKKGFLRGGMDLSNTKALKFTFKHGILAIGSDQTKFYGLKTPTGQKYLAVMMGRKTWHQAFHQAPSKAASKSRRTSVSKTSHQASKTSGQSDQGASGDTTHAAAMNFEQIQRGDYTSLLGTWQETAMASSNLAGETGTNWHQESSYLGAELTITADRIHNPGVLALAGGTLLADESEEPIHFDQNKGGLVASLDNQDGPINYSVSFIPKGVAANESFNNGMTDDLSKNRIVIWTSNNDLTEYFEQQ